MSNLDGQTIDTTDELNKIIQDQAQQIELLEITIEDARKKLFALRQTVEALQQYIGYQAIHEAYSWGQDYLDRTLHENTIRMDYE
jgi:hypothetical protein